MALICPGCESAMDTVKDIDIWIDRCSQCGGVFLDRNELNIVATGMSDDIEYCSIDERAHEDKFAARVCPVCPDRPMRKIEYMDAYRAELQAEDGPLFRSLTRRRDGYTQRRPDRSEAHASPRTTKLYDRRAQKASLDEVDRIIL